MTIQYWITSNEPLFPSYTIVDSQGPINLHDAHNVLINLTSAKRYSNVAHMGLDTEDVRLMNVTGRLFVVSDSTQQINTFETPNESAIVLHSCLNYEVAH